MKKIICVLMIVLGCVSLYAKDFNITNGVLTSYEGIGKNIVIPNGVKYIGANAFTGGETLESVTLPKGLLKIGENAFSDCINLKKVVFNNELKEINNEAFFNCDLETVEIPVSVEKIGTDVFLGTNIKSFSVDENNKNYSSLDGVLYNKNKTNIIAFPIGKTGKYIIPKSVTKLEESVFELADISEITIHGNIKNIPKNALNSCKNLETVNLEEGIETIEKNAFLGCVLLKNIQLPQSLKSIEQYAFEGCKSFTKLDIPSNVKSIGECIIKDCDNLENIFVDENNTTYFSLEGVLLSKDGEKFVMYPLGRKTEIYPIPTSVKEIKSYAFAFANNIKTIVFTDKVEILGDNCFQYMNGLLSVSLPKNIQEMGVNSFSGCQSLTKVEIPDSMLLIPSYTFFNCPSLASINLNNVKIIEDYVFSDCYGLENVEINNVEMILENAFRFCISLKEVKLGEKIKAVGDLAFCGCTSLEKINLPKSLTNLGHDIFLKSHMVEITAPKDSLGAKYAKEYKLNLKVE